jgi:hypothetical protein
MTQGFQRVMNIYTLMGMYMNIRWRPLEVHNISNIYNNICNNNNNRHKKVYKLLDCKQKKVETQLSFAMFKPLELQVPISKLGSTEGFPFEFELESKLVQKMGTSTNGSKNPTT